MIRQGWSSTLVNFSPHFNIVDISRELSVLIAKDSFIMYIVTNAVNYYL